MSDATYHDASTGRFVSPEEAQARPDETVRVTHKGPAAVEPYAPTDAEVLAAAEAIYNSQYPYAAKGKVPLDPVKDTWALNWARAALEAAGEARSRAAKPGPPKAGA